MLLPSFISLPGPISLVQVDERYLTFLIKKIGQKPWTLWKTKTSLNAPVPRSPYSLTRGNFSIILLKNLQVLLCLLLFSYLN